MMGSLENKRRSNNNLNRNFRLKEQEISIKTDNTTKTNSTVPIGNIDPIDKVAEIGNVTQVDKKVQVDRAKETFLPSWMCQSESYKPNIDKDGFITKST